MHLTQSTQRTPSHDGRLEARTARDPRFGKAMDPKDLMTRLRGALGAHDWAGQLEEPEAALARLAITLEARSEYTTGRSERIAELARRLAAAWGLSREDQRNLWRAGLLHDVGKLGLPGDCSAKSGPLSPDDRLLVERHPEIGYEICRSLPSLQTVLPLIRGHHERLDGSGYPDGLRGESLTPALHCLIVADYYDALTHARPYRRALSQEEAFDMLREEVGLGRLLEDSVELLSHVVREAPVVHFS